MFTPRTLGGLEADPVTVAHVAEEIASFDSAAAWALQAGNTGAWWAGHLPQQGVAELFAGGPDLLMPQSRFLEFINEEATRYPHFRIVTGANVQRLLEEGGAVRGVAFPTDHV